MFFKLIISKQINKYYYYSQFMSFINVGYDFRPGKFQFQLNTHFKVITYMLTQPKLTINS